MSPWERQLADEGLAPLDGAQTVNDRGTSWRREVNHEERAEAVKRWQTWAHAVFVSQLFSSPRQQRIWQLYADGKSYSQIQKELGGSRRSVSWAVATVESAAEPKPCANPWRQDLRGQDTAKDPRIVWYAARRRRREELKQKGEPMAAPNPLQLYDLIRLNARDEVSLGIANRRPSDRLTNVMARQTAGGMEIYAIVDKSDPTPKQLPRIILLPWTRIAQADRAQEVA